MTSLTPFSSPSSAEDPLNASSSNNNNHSWAGRPEEKEQGGAEMMTSWEVGALAAVLVAVFVTSVVANVLVCLVFSRRRRSLSLSNRFLANLTACNVLFTLLLMPLAFVSLLSRHWLLGPWLCQGTGLLLNLLVTASTLTLAVISLDRYCAVVTPLHYTLRMTRRRCACFIAGIWVTSGAVSCPPLVGWNRFKFHVNKMICTVAWDSADPADRSYTLFLVTFTFLLPLLAMLWTYARIFRAARDNSERTRRSSIVPTLQSECDPCGTCTPINKRRRSSAVPILRRLSQTSCRSGSVQQRREEWTTAVTSFLVLFSFVLCWLPYFVVICLRALAPTLTLHPVLSTVSTVTAMSACAVNPVVYVLRNKATRRDLRLIFTRHRRGGSFRNEVLHPTVRRVGSVRGEVGVMAGGVRGEKGPRAGLEEGVPTHGECHSIQEERDVPAVLGSADLAVGVRVSPCSIRPSPSLHLC